MGTQPQIKLSIETLNTMVLKLRQHSDAITQVSLEELRQEIILGARCADLLAHVRMAIIDITERCTDENAVRELKALLEECEESSPGVGQP
jgi:hypothetical protein